MTVPTYGVRHELAALVALTLSLAAIPVRAETITIARESLARDTPFRPETQGPNWISYADCRVDDRLMLDVALSSPAIAAVLEVWAGVAMDCLLFEQRDAAGSSCWLLNRTAPAGTALRVEVRTQDVVAAHRSRDPVSGPGSGTIADCDSPRWPAEGTQTTLNFMMVGADGVVLPNWAADSWETVVDVRGPPAPTNLSAKNDQGHISVSFSQGSAATDVRGYDVYCAESVESDAGACRSMLAPGEPPEASLQCGHFAGSFVAGGEVSGLTPDVRYAVALAGVDTVGNVGPLSEVVCVEPHEDRIVAGGCFCSAGGGRSGVPALVGWSGLVALALSRRRRSTCAYALRGTRKLGAA